MRVFDTNAAAMLMDRCEMLEEKDHHSWRCIYVRLHDKEERFNTMLRVNFINRAIVDIMNKDEGYIYFCDDGDIIVLFEGALKPVITRLGRHFGDLDADQLRGQPQDNLFSFFDLSKHWEGFADLCRRKAARILSAREGLSHSATHRTDRVSA
jgi:hypothetical protein